MPSKHRSLVVALLWALVAGVGFCQSAGPRYDRDQQADDFGKVNGAMNVGQTNLIDHHRISPANIIGGGAIIRSSIFHVAACEGATSGGTWLGYDAAGTVSATDAPTIATSAASPRVSGGNTTLITWDPNSAGGQNNQYVEFTVSGTLPSIIHHGFLRIWMNTSATQVAGDLTVTFLDFRRVVIGTAISVPAISTASVWQAVEIDYRSQRPFAGATPAIIRITNTNPAAAETLRVEQMDAYQFSNGHGPVNGNVIQRVADAAMARGSLVVEVPGQEDLVTAGASNATQSLGLVCEGWLPGAPESVEAPSASGDPVWIQTTGAVYLEVAAAATPAVGDPVAAVTSTTFDDEEVIGQSIGNWKEAGVAGEHRRAILSWGNGSPSATGVPAGWDAGEVLQNVGGTLVWTNDLIIDTIAALDAVFNLTGLAGTAGSAGGTVVNTGGVGHTNGAGGDISNIGGAGAGTGAGGQSLVTGGASGTGATGNGGPVVVRGGAALSTNGNGGLFAGIGGLATGTGTGGAGAIAGGVGGATGTGGLASATGGASAGAGGTAGGASVDAGAANGGTGGGVSIGVNNAISVAIGRAAATFALDSTTIDISTLGAITGATGYTGTGVADFATGAIARGDLATTTRSQWIGVAMPTNTANASGCGAVQVLNLASGGPTVTAGTSTIPAHLLFDADGGATGDDSAFITWQVPVGYVTDTATLEVYWLDPSAASEDAGDDVVFIGSVEATAAGEAFAAGTAITPVTDEVIDTADVLNIAVLNIEVEDIVIGDTVYIVAQVDESACQLAVASTVRVIGYRLTWTSNN